MKTILDSNSRENRSDSFYGRVSGKGKGKTKEKKNKKIIEDVKGADELSC
jgi:hypothetical protein